MVIPTEPSSGSDTIMQQSSRRSLDVCEVGNDTRAVTRDRQADDAQVWVIQAVGTNVYALQQRSNGRLMDAHEGSNDNRVVTRDRRSNLTQRWTMVALGEETFALQQVSSATRPFLGSAARQGALVPATLAVPENDAITGLPRDSRGGLSLWRNCPDNPGTPRDKS